PMRELNSIRRQACLLSYCVQLALYKYFINAHRSQAPMIIIIAPWMLYKEFERLIQTLSFSVLAKVLTISNNKANTFITSSFPDSATSPVKT
ncbi:hypothetical protein, partial [Paenibacillus sp. 1-18]|uniref:hypothetical protein n=1 Tax=Paenibacillus sp. 1-18 TaxID=1333846 RepID=UPI001E473E05